MTRAALETLTTAYARTVRERLEPFRPRLREALRPLIETPPPADHTLGFEVFVAELQDRFPVHAYGLHADRQVDIAAANSINGEMDLWPSVLTPDDVDHFTLWVTRADGAEDIADEQPADGELGERSIIDLFRDVWDELGLASHVASARIAIHDDRIEDAVWLSRTSD